MPAWPPLFAAESLAEGMTLVGAFGLVVGALVWFLKHLVEKTIPEERNIFREELKAQRETFTAALSQMDQHHQAILLELRGLRRPHLEPADDETEAESGGRGRVVHARGGHS